MSIVDSLPIYSPVQQIEEAYHCYVALDHKHKTKTSKMNRKSKPLTWAQKEAAFLWSIIHKAIAVNKWRGKI